MSEVAVTQVREALDGAGLLAWARTCRTDLEHRRAEIDALNVFPIADSDTGTNLLATMRAAVAAADVDEADPAGQARAPSAHAVAEALARGATTGARGNSGIILSQVLRGIAEAVTRGPLTGERLRAALRRAAVLVRKGLSTPVEGTILTVLDRAAVAAADAADATLATVARSAADGAALALNETPTQLGVLRAAGVVDAGARGLLVLLDCLVAQVCGNAPIRGSYLRGSHGTAPDTAHRDDAHHASGTEIASRHEAVSGNGVVDVRDEQREQSPDPHFEVMYVIDGADEGAADALRDRLGVLGDSVVVVGDGGTTWSAHVHCRDAGAAIEAGLAIGRLTGIRIESFAVTAPHGHADGHPATGSAHTGTPAALGLRIPDHPVADAVHRHGAAEHHRADRGILSVVDGAAAACLFEDAGAVVLHGDSQLDTAALLAAIRAMPHREVLVLPNGALPAQDLVAAGVAARDGSRDVLLLPSASMVQGLAALAVHDRGRIAVDDAFAMSEAAATTRWGALRAARVRALTMVGMCSPGDGLGLVGNDVVVIDPDVVGAGRILLDRMLGLGGELVTLLMGAAAGPELGAILAEHVTAGFPGVEVVVYSGGQQADLVQIGVE
ncbi:DAK2 domain-containing protein [Nocardia rhizosphaerae]|uniref:DAK2 domain-containing protein n=1 Tax=Nocardia rhizosphaerae TaxID=1691571 RepID=A0ABV8L7Z1_9NOCA